MVKFKLEFPIPKSESVISIRKPLLLFGSCFTVHISGRLSDLRFYLGVNPDGILYDPLQIARSLKRTLEGAPPDLSRIFEQEGIWHSWDAHSRFSALSREALVFNLTESYQTVSRAAQDAEFILVTFGNGWVYELKEGNAPVANCHKVPQQKFNKRLLSIEEITAEWMELIQSPAMSGKKLIFTVSPVRYSKDGLVENNRSKATLIKAIEQITEQSRNTGYFPAYEIVIDELRDYRFYEADLVHPNRLAVDYVFERFCETLFDEETQTIIAELEELNRAKAHRPFNPESAAHAQFLESLKKKEESFRHRYPFLYLKERL